MSDTEPEDVQPLDIAEPAAGGVMPEAPAVLEEPPASVVPEGFTVGKWKQFDNFQCVKCAFSTIERSLIAEHIEKAHQPPRPPMPLIFGPDGKPLNQQSLDS